MEKLDRDWCRSDMFGASSRIKKELGKVLKERRVGEAEVKRSVGQVRFRTLRGYIRDMKEASGGVVVDDTLSMLETV